MAEVADVASLKGNVAVGPGVRGLGCLGFVQFEVEVGRAARSALIIGFAFIFIGREESAHA